MGVFYLEPSVCQGFGHPRSIYMDDGVRELYKVERQVFYGPKAVARGIFVHKINGPENLGLRLFIPIMDIILSSKKLDFLALFKPSSFSGLVVIGDVVFLSRCMKP